MSHGLTFQTSLLEIRDGHLIKTSFFSIKSFFKIILSRQLTDSSIPTPPHPTPPLCLFPKDLFTTTLTNSQRLKRNPQSRYPEFKLPTYLPTHPPTYPTNQATNQSTNQPAHPPHPTAQPSPPPPLSHQNNLPISYPLPQPLPSFQRINKSRSSISTRQQNPHPAHGKHSGGGGVRTGVGNCDLLGEFIRWGRWMYEGRGGCGWKKLERGRMRLL